MHGRNEKKKKRDGKEREKEEREIGEKLRELLIWRSVNSVMSLGRQLSQYSSMSS